MRHRWAGVLVGTAAIATSSCAPPMIATAGVSAAQAGTMAFVNGDAEVAARVPMDAVFLAAHQALERLEIPNEKESLYPNIAFLTGKLGDGRRIKIVLIRESAVVTKLSLRVGVLGDQPISRVVISEIQHELTPQWGSSAEPAG